jgi:hypothetical protein
MRSNVCSNVVSGTSHVAIEFIKKKEINYLNLQLISYLRNNHITA